VWDILEDREGNLWIATQNGLDRLRKGKFTMLTRSDGLPSNDVAALVVMRDSLFAGSASGLTRTTANQTKIVSRSATLAMAGTVDGALLVAQPQGIGWLQSDYVKHLGILAKHVTALAQDSGRTLWFYEQQKGLFRWQPGGTVAPVMLPGHGQELVTVIQADARGGTWFGLASGALVLHRDGNFRSFSTKDGLAGGVPHSISTLPDGEAWIASERGLSLYADHHFTRWTRRNGLPGNRVLWALPGPDGLLWLGYNVGVASVHIEDLRRAASDASFQVPFDFFDEGDGLKSNPDLRSGSPAALTADGRLWLTTVEGVATLDLEHIPRDTVPPPVHILAFRADDVDANPAGGVNLPSHTRRVEINYTGLSLTDPGRVTFQYRLLGFDPHWQDVGGHRFAAYTNLPPGQYRFEVKAANEDGVWSNVPAVLIFSIAPAIYQTAWFMVICVVTILLATAALIRLRVRMAARTLRLRFEERLEERARVAQDLHDNLLQDVMGISLQLEIADELTPFGAPGKPVLQRALVLSAATLAGGRGVLTTLRTTSLSLQDLMRDIALALEAFPEERQHTVRLIADESALLVRASVGEELVQIAREALRNALQHTAGRVSVRCHSASGHLHLVVEDEGLGIESAILASGVPGHYGLRGMQERADRIAATLRFRSREGGGLRVELDVPADIAFVQEEVTRTLWTRIMARWRRANNTADRLND
jgi:signal transduction histidine kinase